MMNGSNNRPAVQRDLRCARTDDAVLRTGATVYSVAQARAIVRRMAEVTASMDPDAFANGHTEDCLVCFVRGPTLIGRRAVRDYMAARLTPERVGFTCGMTLRTMNGNVLGVQWTSTWNDARNDKNIRTRGVGFWIMQGEQVARCDGAVNFWED
jgi:SnoaL-like domain